MYHGKTSKQKLTNVNKQNNYRVWIENDNKQQYELFVDVPREAWNKKHVVVFTTRIGKLKKHAMFSLRTKKAKNT